MGTEKKSVKHERIREDVLAAIDAVKTITPSIPPIALYAWSLRQFLRPFKTTLEEPGTYAGNSDLGISAELLLRMAATVAPFAALLGVLYQGLQGAVAGVVAAMIPAATLTMLEVNVIKKDDPAEEPFPGSSMYATLSWWDALFLAGIVPLILETLRGQGVERGSIL